MITGIVTDEGVVIFMEDDDEIEYDVHFEFETMCEYEDNHLASVRSDAGADVDAEWVEDLVEEVESQQESIVESFETSSKGAYLAAIDNVVDDCDSHADVPEEHDREFIYEQVRKEVAVKVEEVDPQ